MQNSADDSLIARIRLLPRRLGPELAWCLSLAVGFGVLLLVAYLASGLLDKIPAARTMASFDVLIVRYIVEHRTGWLTTAMRIITDLGGDVVLLIVALAAGVTLRRQNGSWRPLLVLLAIAVGAIELERLIKLMVARPRPPAAWRVFHEQGWSFPSGHAAHSAASHQLRRPASLQHWSPRPSASPPARVDMSKSDHCSLGIRYGLRSSVCWGFVDTSGTN
jgi:hypothetical protein